MFIVKMRSDRRINVQIAKNLFMLFVEKATNKKKDMVKK